MLDGGPVVALAGEVGGGWAAVGGRGRVDAADGALGHLSCCRALGGQQAHGGGGGVGELHPVNLGRGPSQEDDKRDGWVEMHCGGGGGSGGGGGDGDVAVLNCL